MDDISSTDSSEKMEKKPIGAMLAVPLTFVVIEKIDALPSRIYFSIDEYLGGCSSIDEAIDEEGPLGEDSLP